ncbi:MAG: hypothetical protein KJ061_15465 [Vicinamibacteraceae bacterium]|nr:hypothetical protein [Vicinamibacteraceae bacterium]
MTQPGADSLLARLERDAMVFVALAAVASVVVRGGRFDVALGVLGGGVLSFVSYRAIKGGVDALVDLLASAGGLPAGAEAPEALEVSEALEVPEGLEMPEARDAPPPPQEQERPRLPRRARPVAAAARFAGRYALLGFLAYVMIARLRLHPVGLLIGVSSVVAAAAIEAVRQLSGADRPQGPRGRPPAS